MIRGQGLGVDGQSNAAHSLRKQRRRRRLQQHLRWQSGSVVGGEQKQKQKQ
jgi:hypothetical protein